MNDEDEMKAYAGLEKYAKELEKEAIQDRMVIAAVKHMVDEKTFKAIEETIEDSPGNHFEIVNKAVGEEQEEDGYVIYVDQYVNGGYTGDHFEGYIYFKLKEDQFLKWNYNLY